MQNLAYDTETTGLHPHRGDRMFAYSTCDEEGGLFVRRIRDGNKADRGGVERLVASARNGVARLVMHNSKFDLTFTEKLLGCRIAERVGFHDTKIMAQLLRNDHHGHGLKDLAWELAGVPKDDEAEVRRYARNAEDMDYSRVPEEIMERYQERDARRTMLLFKFFDPKLKGKLRDCYDWELRVIAPTMRMEGRGFMIDRGRTEKLRREMEVDAIAAMNTAEEEYGRRINIGNDNVLRFILYTEKRLPVLAKTSKTGLPSVEKEILAELYRQTKDPLLRLAVRYKSRRRGAKMLQSYLDCADEAGVIHPDIKTIGAVTGRESCSNPNLQNVEKNGGLQNPFPTPARKAFRPRPGYVNFHVDYAGIELRLLVHYSKDPELVCEIGRPGGDPHALAATIFYPSFSLEERETWPEFCFSNPIIAAGFEAWPEESDEWNALRDLAKGTNFAVPYGAGPAKAAANLGLPDEIGLKRFEEYRRRFPRLCSMTRNVVATVKEKHGVETTFGRFLRVPREKEYVGVNYLIQGTAAEILKRAQVRVHAYLERATGGECGLIIPIHDELVVEWPRKRLKDAPKCWREIREMMIDFPQFDVPLEVKVSTSTTDWGEKKEFVL